jgi:hypothetical protein
MPALYLVCRPGTSSLLSLLLPFADDLQLGSLQRSEGRALCVPYEPDAKEVQKAWPNAAPPSS